MGKNPKNGPPSQLEQRMDKPDHKRTRRGPNKNAETGQKLEKR
jgi:hypothetical protein